MTAPDLVAVVLAAGASTRFGTDKLLHELHGRPLGAHIADTLAAFAPARVAICPPDSPGRFALFASRGFDIVENEDAHLGMSSSLALGAQCAMQRGASAMLVCLADMPNVTVTHLDLLVAASRDADVAMTIAGGVRSPPAIFAAAILPLLASLTGDHGARDLAGDAATVEADLELVRDYDTPADFVR